MRKKILYFIIFIILCFVVNIGVYRAYELNCHYKLDPFDGYNVGNSIWLNYHKENLSDQWELVTKTDGNIDAWYQYSNDQDGNPNNLKNEGYEIPRPNAESTTCPSGIVVDTAKKTIEFTNEVYHLYKQNGYVNEEGINEYECEYERNENGEYFKYFLRFKKNDDGNYVYSDLFQYNDVTGKTGGVTGNKERVTQGLTYIKSTTNTGNTFDDLICPQIAIDKGDKIEFITEERYNLESQWTDDEGKLVCKYYENVKTSNNNYSYWYQLHINDVGSQTYKSKSGVGGWHHKWLNGLTIPGGAKSCPLILKVKWENEYWFPNKLYFHSVDNSESHHEHCMSITSENLCKVGTENYSCVWVEDESLTNGGYCNINNLQFIACGDAYDIPGFLPNLTSLLVTLLKTAAPIILIFVSIISLLKALAASKEDEIKKAQKSLVRKIIAAAMVFFIISIVQFVIEKIADDNEVGHIDDCLTCLLNDNCKSTTYYKANLYGESVCKYLNGEVFECPEDSLTK